MKGVVGVLGPGLKRPGREADFYLPSSAEVKNESSCTFPSLPPTSHLAGLWIGAAIFKHVSLKQSLLYHCQTSTADR